MVDRRIHWIDIARAFFIIAIVIGHLYNDGYIRYWVFSFHVPAFFFISGFCFKYKVGFIRILKEKVRKIVIPYLVFSLFSILIFWIASLLIPGVGNLLECDLATNIFVMLYGNSKPNTMKYNLPLWFLSCFFVVSVALWCIESLNKKWNKSRILCMIFCVILGGILSKIQTIILPWHIETAVSMIVWSLLGIEMRSHWEKIEHFFEERSGSIQSQYRNAIFLIALGAWAATFNSRIVGVRNDHYGNLIVYYIAAFVSICGFLYLSYCIHSNKALEYIGRNSLVILALHKFPIIFFQEMLKPTAEMLAVPNSLSAIVCGAIVASISIGISLLSGIFIERFCPWALGLSRTEDMLSAIK